MALGTIPEPAFGALTLDEQEAQLLYARYEAYRRLEEP